MPGLAVTSGLPLLSCDLNESSGLETGSLAIPGDFSHAPNSARVSGIKFLEVCRTAVLNAQLALGKEGSVTTQRCWVVSDNLSTVEDTTGTDNTPKITLYSSRIRGQIDVQR